VAVNDRLDADESTNVPPVPSICMSRLTLLKYGSVIPGDTALEAVE